MKLDQLRAERVTVSESSLSRLLNHSQAPFAIITAYRSDYNKQQNIERNRALRTDLNSRKMGVHQLIGHWREYQDKDVPYDQCPPGQLRDVIERSYFVTKPPTQTTEDFTNYLTSLANSYDQDAIILSNGHTTYTIHRNGQQKTIGSGQPTLSKIGQAYSQHIRKQNIPFVFEGIEMPTSNIGRIAWKAAGLVVPSTAADDIHDLVFESIN